ncbi:hypothetical protein NC99_30450 [Sunxiuqinia dokdonensis]|uniref:Uncharacterized protein n=1 Tax=Sunxiuqinia dokdonensis TaxID=1409788 RepID=A0A0L8V766_9BACT|nr:hypothetical protein NC99_30450 [Sunxiuqinia dokdonensis]
MSRSKYTRKGIYFNSSMVRLVAKFLDLISYFENHFNSSMVRLVAGNR